MLLGLALHELARVGPLETGDNISDMVQTDADRVLWGPALTAFVLVSVGFRHLQTIPIVIAVVEAAVLAAAVLWPAVNDWAVRSIGDSQPFPYQTLFAIAWAGAVLGLLSSVRKPELPELATAGSEMRAD